MRYAHAQVNGNEATKQDASEGAPVPGSESRHSKARGDGKGQSKEARHDKRRAKRQALHEFFQAQNARDQRQARIKAGTATKADIEAETEAVKEDASSAARSLRASQQTTLVR